MSFFSFPNIGLFPGLLSYSYFLFFFYFLHGRGWIFFFVSAIDVVNEKLCHFTQHLKRKKKYQARRFSSSSWVAFSFRTSNEKQFVGADSFVMDWPCKEMADDRFTSLTAFNLQDRFDGRKKGRFIKIIFIFKRRIFFFNLFSRVFFFFSCLDHPLPFSRQ